MDELALAAIAGLAGWCLVAGTREMVLASPLALEWLAMAVEPLVRAGREGYVPTLVERRRLALVGAGAMLLAGLVLAGVVAALAAALVAPALAATAISRRRARYRRSVEGELPQVAVAIADALGGGRSVRGALAEAAGSLRGPVGAEMARLAADLDLGASTAEALDGVRGRVRSAEADSFVMVLASQRLAGGDLALLLRRYAVAAIERRRLADEARTATAQARFTGALVAAMPAGGALFAELIEPGFVARLLADPAARVLLVLSGFLQAAGFVAIRRLGAVER